MKRWLAILVSFAVGCLVVPFVIAIYLNFGRPPVAVHDGVLPMEKTVVRKILHDRIDSEMRNSPLQASSEVLSAGAVVYKEQCAFCHGLPDHPSAVGSQMFPTAPQLWKSHKNGVVGVSDDPVGETFWRVKNGIRLTGMPSYKDLLSEDQMWQVSLLLSSADKPVARNAMENSQTK